MTCTMTPSMTLPGCPVPPQLGTGVSTTPPTAPLTHLTTVVPHLAQQGGLPFTGADILQLAIVGLVVVALGALLLLRSRATRRLARAED